MTRMFLPAAALLATGCLSQLANSPPDIEDRLARVEERRTTSAAGRPDAWTQFVSDQPRTSRVHSNQPPALVEQLGMADAVTVRRDFFGGLHLVELGDPPTGETRQSSAHSETYAETDRARKKPLPSFWETARRDLKDMPSDLWRDTKRVYANPTNLAILGAAYGGSLALQESRVDDHIAGHFNHRNDFEPAHHHFKEDWRDAFGALGNPATHFALAGAWYLLGQQTSNDKTYEVGKTLFSALMINGVTVMAGQAATSDRAPNGEWGTFPSGHTSSSFVVASVLHEAYGHAVGIPLYGLAALVAHERLEDGEHYFSDVVMGAVLGTVVGHSVASGRNPEFFGWKMLPYASPQGGTGVAFMKSLD